ncbi:hypothetical protein RN001_000641 [Aquatica leii]|uniref:Bifunctional glutamate/proline--tRNA ligase n=1 Tax=Aquatica leii TaxID=1421715 RepID=A0AAN7SSH4_9COLE|nr:hypothetical protein RN001_000641 [Aquatica leii]
MKITCNTSSPPLGGVLIAEYARTLQKQIEIVWGNVTIVEFNGQKYACSTSNDVARIIARKLAEDQLYGTNPTEKSEVDHWLSVALGPLSSKQDFIQGIQSLNNILSFVTYLVGKRLTIADFIVFAALYINKQWQGLVSKKEAPANLLRWYNFLKGQDFVKKVIEALPQEAKDSLNTSISSRQSLDRSTTGRAQEGKFVELPGAEMGKVVVRFPPEASGYLHIGHAKAALLNQYYQQAFQGKLIMRFDDTNPAKENIHFEKVILEDIEMLEIKPDLFTHTSQYFDIMLEYCEKLLKEGKAYVDDTEPELMKQQREQKIESQNRSNSYEKNKQLWNEMLKGTEKGLKCCVRAKIDMQSLNGCMRDPTIYRCKNEPHPRTGTKYKVYPTYDFACPIVDAIEDVTHTLRTMEYHDRDAQFYWFIEALGLRRPYIWEYSRLSMTNTVLSKRKLTWFVENNLVDGWDDPRFPTVRGILRRGMTVEGLKQFIIAQGSSRSVVFMEWDKIWAFNKKVIDPIAPRYTALEYENPIPVLVKGVKEERLEVPKHPKNNDIGLKAVWIGPRILIDLADAETLKVGEVTTFINWGNLLIKKINRENNKIVSVEAEPNLENKDYKKTLKLTWLSDTENAMLTPTWCVYFDHIISKPLLGKDEDFKQFVGHETKKSVQMLGDPELKKLKKGDIIQLQRRGFFKVETAYEPLNLSTCKERAIILFSIPDGHTKASPTAGAAFATGTQEIPVTSTEKPKTAEDLNKEITAQGDTVRNLKGAKAAKNEIDSAVKVLLELKAQYKAITNIEWKPGCTLLDSSVSEPSTDSSDVISAKITTQGEKVRQLKSSKAPKESIDTEVRLLLNLKNQYKQLTGSDWKPDAPTIKVEAPFSPTSIPDNSISESILLNKITAQGDKVRDLKSKKAEKSVVDAEVNILLTLKADYKSLTGNAWKPGTTPAPIVVETKHNEAELLDKISSQGNKIRQLKTDKAEKGVIDTEVKALLCLKEEYKKSTGEDWKPGASVSPTSTTMTNSTENELGAKIHEQGEVVRKAKASGAPKDEIDAEVKKLLNLKAEYKTVTGKDISAPTRTSKAKEEKPSKHKQEKKKEKIEVDDGSALKKQTRLGLEAKKEENLSDWYSQVITKGELIEYYDVSGCYILRPWSYSIWEAIKDWFDVEIKKLGVQNCYFPIFVSRAALEKEKSHIEDFSPEVAWVTKSGDSDLAEPVAVRPTSETVMYPAYAKWVQSYRDLPIKMNQWNNVVRWEFKHPQPFLRTREFLWQEGHTAYANLDDCQAEVKIILDLYAKIYTDLLAIPVIKGRKTEKEKFAGGDYTLTIEGFISASGRGIQAATSHFLGQNFSKMFEIVYDDPETQEKKFVYQNSWGITTRSIGVMVMVHGDNQGLVIPPRVASIQIIIVPCGVSVGLSETERQELQINCDELEKELNSTGMRVKGDYRENYSPGWKFNHWELKGVPIRVELGPKDIKNKQIVAVRRDTGQKVTFKRDSAVKDLAMLLENIQQHLFNKASEDFSTHTVQVTEWAQFTPNLDKKNVILTPFCGDMSCEDKIKADSTRDASEAAEVGAPSMGAKSLCIPLEQPPMKPNAHCIHPDCKNKPKFYTLFGRSY